MDVVSIQRLFFSPKQWSISPNFVHFYHRELDKIQYYAPIFGSLLGGATIQKCPLLALVRVVKEKIRI